MSLAAEIAATCNALGYYDEKTDKYFADSNTLETVKDLIRYLRKDDENHDVRRQLGQTKVLETDLLPLVKSYWEQTDLFDVLLRLMVNLTTPPIMLWNDEVPTDKTTRNYYLQIEDHLKSYKQAFADASFWAILSERLGRVLEIDYTERGNENSLVIERILILMRNILYVTPDPAREKRPDNDANIHDQVLFALHQSGILDIILYITTSANEKAYYMHTLEILSFMLREQKASELANAALQRTEMEKIRDEAELLAIRHKETHQRQEKVKKYNVARHSLFGGTFVLKSMKSISDNELIYHKPLDKLDALNFDANKMKRKTPKNRMPVEGSSCERRSTFAIRIFLKEFCVEFLNGAYNTLMYYVKDSLVRAKNQAHDESYYLWALRFFMEFNRCYKFEVKLVSETMSIQTFHYVQQQMETYFDMIRSDKKKTVLWSRRLHLALLAYKELLSTICVMDKSPDGSVRDSAKVIKNNIFYVLEYREFIVSLLVMYDELKMSNVYLKDLMETQHIFLKMLESFTSNGSVVVQKKQTRRKRKGANNKKRANLPPNSEDAAHSLEVKLQDRWDEISPQLSIVLEDGVGADGAVPFDAASDVPIDEQKSEAMKNVQRKLRNGEFENAISLLRAAREVWPENDCFGSDGMATEQEFLALRDIFFADLGENEDFKADGLQATEDAAEESDEDEEDEDESHIDVSEGDFKFEDVVKRLANYRIVRACGLALKNFESNSVNTNHCILKLLHRIAFDCKLYVMVFQVSIFQTFQRIFANKMFPQYKELVKFATYIMRQFMKVAETNKKIYMECLFWKNAHECYEIEHGYSATGSKAIAKAWSEEQEDELQRLFSEHQQNQLEEDIVDWIVNNLVDNTRSRRAVLKKLKEMCLLSDYKGRRQIPHQHRWGPEEEIQLRELYETFKDDANPLACLMPRLDVSRSKGAVVQKLLEMGLVQDKSELRKKRKTKANKSAGGEEGGATTSNQDSSSDDNETTEGGRPTTSSNNKLKKLTKKKPSAGRSKAKQSPPVPYGSLVKYLLNVMNLGMGEALGWIREVFMDAIEDLESGDLSEGIPIVPIMDYAIDAMDSFEFQSCLTALGIAKPDNEQESYWRIPSIYSISELREKVRVLGEAIDGTLKEAEEAGESDKDLNNSVNHHHHRSSSDEDDDVFDRLRNIMSKKSDDGNDEDEINSTATKSNRNVIESDSDNESASVGNVSRRIIDSDEDGKMEDKQQEDDDDMKRNRNDSSSDSEKPRAKRSRRIIESDDE